jgi:hypothetical protein
MANYVNLYAPFNGIIVKTVNGSQGGKTIYFKPDNQEVMMRFMHLNLYKATGRVKEGDLIAITGNTGGLSTAPHLHLDIAKNWQGNYWNNINNFIDPEQFNWGKKGDTMEDLWKRPDERVINSINIAVYGDNIPKGDTAHWVQAFKDHPDWDLDYMARDKRKVVEKMIKNPDCAEVVKNAVKLTKENCIQAIKNMD